jgi:predicted nucleotidyltransferase
MLKETVDMVINEITMKIYNRTLDPKIWDGNLNLRPGIREALLKIAQDFYNTTDFEGDLIDILFLGSVANYNWSPTSDIDLHIVIDVASEKIAPDYARKFMDTLAAKWNNDHELEIKGHPVEVYLQDIGEINRTESSYSIIDNRWVTKPIPKKLTLDRIKIQQKYHEIKNRINTMVNTQDVTKLQALMKAIRNYREAGLSSGGEWSTENVVFKALRHTDMLTKLKDAINTIYDRQVSLKEVVDIDRYFIIGLVSDDGEVIAMKDYVGGDNINHETLLLRNRGWLRKTAKEWRYKSKYNTIYWYGGLPDKIQEEIVLDYLHTKYNIKNPHQREAVLARDWSNLTNVNELAKKFIDPKKYLIVGFVNASLEVVGVRDFEGVIAGDPTHTAKVKHSLLRSLAGPVGYDWQEEGQTQFRYKSKNNTLYWWPETASTMNEMMRDSVLDWLASRYNVKNPKEVMNSVEYITQAHYVDESMKESKFDPFKAKKLEFVTYGGLSLTKQKGYKGQDQTFHSPPAGRGIYAFVCPYVEKFLLGGYGDPKERGKGQRQRIQYVRDKDGNVIDSDHPEFEKRSDTQSLWSLQRKRDDAPGKKFGDDEFEWDKEFKNILYRNTPRKKFKYNGPIWSHLTDKVKQHEILDEKGSWVKTDMKSYIEALKKELHDMSKNVSKFPNNRGFKEYALDHLEVFIDSKI